jgi:hypothetical protein
LCVFRAPLIAARAAHARSHCRRRVIFTIPAQGFAFVATGPNRCHASVYGIGNAPRVRSSACHFGAGPDGARTAEGFRSLSIACGIWRRIDRDSRCTGADLIAE